MAWEMLLTHLELVLYCSACTAAAQQIELLEIDYLM